ncbi:hypothetical protein P43SY_007885 [Pythium insidiosum]|uniref:Uncharacterized protein n=1 Tax=Pythium insidiosum TaxID=114742 RepID=A0AAD5LLK2_PYTIN|nr:hypothetical protein P43SY_007885 [Pythium insidiosum]
MRARPTSRVAAAATAPSLQRRLLLVVLVALVLFEVLRSFGTQAPVVSVLHPRTPSLSPANGPAPSHDTWPLRHFPHAAETTQTFPQYGTSERGVHYRLENTLLLSKRDTRKNALLVVVVLNDHTSWGPKRSAADFFELFAAFTHPKHQTSLTLLTSSATEFRVLQQELQQRIHEYAVLSLLLRNDLNLAHSLSRDNRHDHRVQKERRRMLARYRNFALLSTLAPWHEHVVWLDADVHIVPPVLVSKMIASQREIVEPICLYGEPPNTYEYDLNAWVGTRKRPGSLRGERNGFVPGDLHVNRMTQYRDDPREFIPLDSVGGTMLYVRAEVHRQGVLFPHHYVVGGQWDLEGFDGIETEGLCYSAHFLGFKCWGMPHDAIYHVRSASGH